MKGGSHVASRGGGSVLRRRVWTRPRTLHSPCSPSRQAAAGPGVCGTFPSGVDALCHRTRGHLTGLLHRHVGCRKGTRAARRSDAMQTASSPHAFRPSMA